VTALSTPNTGARSAGILLHVSSLPGPHGIGDLGPAAHDWIDRLAAAKLGWWQILPLGPPAAGNCPYQCYSAFAGNPQLISPASLVEDGLLDESDIEGPQFPQQRVDFSRVTAFKSKLLDRAWARFANRATKLQSSFEQFCTDESSWLDDYALFMAIKERNGSSNWTTWHKPIARRHPSAIASARRELADAIRRQQFIQFLFFRQLDVLRRYAHLRNVKLIGDLPIFISADSSDVWANPHVFLLDRDRRPKAVAGVPPDAFSSTGQRWGNPLYRWSAMKKDGFAWWIARVRAALKQADLIRLDHFRGFIACWQIPADHPTAEHGRWVRAPGRELFAALQRALGSLPFIAEDLGMITPDVEALRDEMGLPGMRVLQFGFGGGWDNPHLPHQFVRNCVAYTGTHDNDTTIGWHASLHPRDRKSVERYLGSADRDIAGQFIRLAWSSIADLAIAPMQDVLRLGPKARMNVPGKANGNWAWRMTDNAAAGARMEQLAEWTETYNRQTRGS